MADEEVAPIEPNILPRFGASRNTPKDGEAPTPFDIEIGEGFDADSKVLTVDQAIGELTKRLRVPDLNRLMAQQGIALFANGTGMNSTMSEAIRKMVLLLPESARTEDIIKNGDIRLFLDQTLKAMDDDGAAQGVNFSRHERAVLATILDKKDTEITAEIEKTLIEGVPAGDTFAMETAIASAQNIAKQYQSGTLTRLNDQGGEVYVDPASGGYKATAGSAGLDDFLADLNSSVAGDQLTPTKFLSGKDVQALFQSGEMTVDQYRSLQTDPIEMRGMLDGQQVGLVGSQGVNYDDETSKRQYGLAPGVGTNTQMRSAEVEVKEWYSVREILRKPGEMTRPQLMVLHDKMKKAGMFDLVGGEPVIPGDSTDPAFKAAWKQLTSMSLEKGVSMTSLLDERVSSHQDELMSSLSTQLTDPARLRINGDAYARDALGRKLTQEEHAEMRDFLHNLERRNTMVAAGLDTENEYPGIESLDEGIVADIDAQMAGYLEQEFATEAGASDTADQYDMFKRMLSGPGRGVS